MEQTKELSFEFEGTQYTLAFTRRTVRLMEQNGFSPDMVTSKPAIGIPMLFKGAFIAKNKWVKDEVKDKIYGKLINKDELISKLLQMYSEPINAMFEEPEDDEKKVTWEANF